MSVHGRKRQWPQDERLQSYPNPLRRGYSDVDAIEMVEVNGVWMTPEDARRVKDAA